MLSSSDSAKSPEGLLIGKEQFLDMTGSHVFFGTIGRPRIERLELDFDLSDQVFILAVVDVLGWLRRIRRGCRFAHWPF